MATRPSQSRAFALQSHWRLHSEWRCPASVLWKWHHTLRTYIAIYFQLRGQVSVRLLDIIIVNMKFTIAIASGLLAVPALAQTPATFTPGTNATLDVYYGTQYISPGLIIKKSSTIPSTLLNAFETDKSIQAPKKPLPSASLTPP